MKEPPAIKYCQEEYYNAWTTQTARATTRMPPR